MKILFKCGYGTGAEEHTPCIFITMLIKNMSFSIFVSFIALHKNNCLKRGKADLMLTTQHFSLFSIFTKTIANKYF